LTFQIRKRGARRLEVQPEFTPVGDNVIVGSAAWLAADGRRQERFQVITLRDGKIADMQGCRSRREAEHIARRRVRTFAASGAR
jgi:hypothetical protein